MSGITSSQQALLERIEDVAKDQTISVTAFFEHMPTGYVLFHPFVLDGVLNFQTVSGATARFRGDALIGIIEVAT